MSITKAVYTLSQVLRSLGVHFNEQKDARVQSMKETINRLNGLQFNIELYPDGNWTAESTNIQGILTGGTRKEKMDEMIKDAVFTYFQIPPHLCQDSLLRGLTEPVKIEQRVYA